MNVMLLENVLGVICEPVGVGVYDFDFGLHFRCSHPYEFVSGTPAVLRIGAIQDYESQFAEKERWGLRLVNSVAQHTLASELEAWYPHLAGLTPATQIYDSLPDADDVERHFSWPVFLKGSRQTSKHNPDLAVIKDRAHYERARRLYREDPILSWQKPVLRQFVELAPVEGTVPGKIRPSVEFRSFWWQGHCVGVSRYWYQLPDYKVSDFEKGLALAKVAAQRLRVPFLVVDFAKTSAGDWIVIECNDGQEAGLAAIPPLALWSAVVRLVATQP